MDNFFDMQIRKLTCADIPIASALCLEAFTLAVAPSLTEQGVEAFAAVAAEHVPAATFSAPVRSSAARAAHRG
ncbi:hypothetical protein [Pseudomonas sp. NPDC086566]|uniref:hypothetical protein n=1 Tax=Pseudomonas sp. NPDC086566 TaxID=3390647 RepID=UPI003D086F63